MNKLNLQETLQKARLIADEISGETIHPLTAQKIIMNEIKLKVDEILDSKLENKVFQKRAEILERKINEIVELLNNDTGY